MMVPAGKRSHTKTAAERSEAALAAAGARGAPLFGYHPLGSGSLAASGAESSAAASMASRPGVLTITWRIDATGTSTYYGLGLAKKSVNLKKWGGIDKDCWMLLNDGRKGNKANWQSYASSALKKRWVVGDTISVTYDKNSGDVHFFKNDKDMGKAYTLPSGLSRELYPVCTLNNSSESVRIVSGNFAWTEGGSNGSWTFSGPNNCVAQQQTNGISGSTAIAGKSMQPGVGGAGSSVSMAVKYPADERFAEFVAMRRDGKSPEAVKTHVRLELVLRDPALLMLWQC